MGLSPLVSMPVLEEAYTNDLYEAKRNSRRAKTKSSLKRKAMCLQDSTQQVAKHHDADYL